LAAAALVVLAVNPSDLFNVGAQLSFVSVAGLAWFARHLVERDQDDALRADDSGRRPWWYARLRPAWRFAWALTRVGLLMWLVTLPLVSARFHLVTPIAPIVNAILWVPMEVAMVGGMGLLALGRIPLLGPLCGGLCNGAFHVLSGGVALARAVPGGHFWVPGPAGWWLLGYYAGLGLLLALPRFRPPRRWCLAMLAGWIALGLGVAALGRPRGELDCTFLSIGHGCGVVLELPSGKTVIYDAGQLGAPAAAGRTVAGHLWARGKTHVDAIVISHSDVDHYDGIPYLLDRFSVGVVYVSPVMFEEDSPALSALRQAIQRARVPVRVIRAGDRLDGGPGCTLDVLHPPRNGVLGSDNANSLVVAAEYQGRRIMLPGDLESPGLDDLLAEEPYHCDVLMAPHHGSRRSNAPGLVAWATPDWIVISGAHARDYHEVEATYRATGRRFLHTADAGAVTVRIKAGQVALEPFCQ
jgi:competence protein ComEC